MVLAAARIREPTMTIPTPSQNSHQVGCGMKATPPAMNPAHTITVPIHEILRPLKCSPSCAAPATGCAAVPPGPSTVPVVARSATTHPPTIRYAHAAVMKNTPTFPGGTHQPPRPPAGAGRCPRIPALRQDPRNHWVPHGSPEARSSRRASPPPPLWVSNPPKRLCGLGLAARLAYHDMRGV